MHDMYDIGHTSQLGTKGTIARNAQGTMCTIGTKGTIDGTFKAALQAHFFKRLPFGDL